MGRAESPAMPDARPSGSARPRLVLGVVLLALGLGDVLFMNIALLPEVLVVEAVASPRPALNTVPSADPLAQGVPQAGSTTAAQEMAVAPVVPSGPSPARAPAPRAAAANPPSAPVPTKPPSTETPSLTVTAAQAVEPPSGRAAIAEPFAGGVVPPSPERAESGLAPLRFSPNSAWLSRESGKTLTQLAALLESDPTRHVTLDGHTDHFGPERFNQMLSLKRAERALTRLQDLGIGRERIDIKGFGSERPVDTDRTARACARNRRVEITLY